MTMKDAIYPRMQIVRGHKHTCANVQIGSTSADKCDCGALDSAGHAIPVCRCEDTPPAPRMGGDVGDDEPELIERLLDAQQDINFAANTRMDQSLCDASALIDEIEPILRAAIRAAPSDDLHADVRRLVIAARDVAYEDPDAEKLRELDNAVEAFAERVRWDNDPAIEAMGGSVVDAPALDQAPQTVDREAVLSALADAFEPKMAGIFHGNMPRAIAMEYAETAYATIHALIGGGR